MFADPIPFQTIAVTYVALLASLSVHECAHAACSHWLGDDTAKDLGRMTLNPIPHIDILGTLVLPLFGMISGWRVLGWAKPVPVDPRRLSRKFTVRTGMSLVAGAGPASNLLFSLVCLLALCVLINVFVGTLGMGQISKGQLFLGAINGRVEQFSYTHDYLGTGQIFLLSMLGKMVIINIGLAIFNLLPFGPLDGASIMRGVLPGQLVPSFDRIQPVLTIVVLAAFFLGFIKYILEPLFIVAFNYYIIPIARMLLT